MIFILEKELSGLKEHISYAKLVVSFSSGVLLYNLYTLMF